jgi:hypothetical protein
MCRLWKHADRHKTQQKKRIRKVLDFKKKLEIIKKTGARMCAPYLYKKWHLDVFISVENEK